MHRSRLSIFLGISTLLTLSLWAQESASSGIVGEVTDSTHAAIPGAAITLVNIGTNSQRSAVTDTLGNFSLPNLSPGVYEIRVVKTGFQTAILKDFDLRVGQIARPTITMAVGAISESVSVQAETPL